MPVEAPPTLTDGISSAILTERQACRPDPTAEEKLTS